MFGNKLKLLLKNKKEEHSGNDKKKIENLVFFIIILIITVVIINYIWNGNKSTKSNTNSTNKKLASQNDVTSEVTQSNENTLGNSLEEILGKIQGVGEVKVFLNYSESTETMAMYNENSKTSVTEETDTSGGLRKKEETDTDKEIVYQESDGNKTPIVQKTIEPKIEGAIITAKGAGNANVKKSIIDAVEAVTGLATHKIQVFEME